MEHVQLIGIDITHCIQCLHCFLGLDLIDLAHCKTNVNQYPITGTNTLRSYQCDVHVSLDTGYFHFCDRICIIYNVYDLARNSKTHVGLLASLHVRRSYCYSPETDSTMIRWQTRVPVDLESHFLQALRNLCEQQLVLKHS